MKHASGDHEFSFKNMDSIPCGFKTMGTTKNIVTQILRILLEKSPHFAENLNPK